LLQRLLCLIAMMVVAAVAAEPASGQTGYDCRWCDPFLDECTTDAPNLDDRCVEAASGEWCSSWGNLMDCDGIETEEELLAIVPLAIGASGTVMASPMWLTQGVVVPEHREDAVLVRGCSRLVVARSYSSGRSKQIKILTQHIVL